MHDNSEHASYHYGVIARAIELIGASNSSLSLEQLASKLNMSPSHFQRVFTHWVGVSPKRYQQYLTLDCAKRLLAERHTVLETADAAGLSGGGRLHDLFLRWEAMSPGEYARCGEGLEIYWSWTQSPFGPALIMGTARGICGIGFSSYIGDDDTFSDMISRWPKAVFSKDSLKLEPWINSIFDKSDAPVPLYLIGAPFQIKVWEALLAIPSGNVVTYSDIAQHIGKPKAVRAVGTAVGRNPVSWLIPCHRALRKSGELGGYHWGLTVKRAMLAWETARLDAAE